MVATRYDLRRNVRPYLLEMEYGYCGQGVRGIRHGGSGTGDGECEVAIVERDGSGYAWDANWSDRWDCGCEWGSGVHGSPGEESDLVCFSLLNWLTIGFDTSSCACFCSFPLHILVRLAICPC